tara:strand:+ start:1 stop:1797 length:1797 start_codon:yes stop_codon:yes gene_type:complete
MTVGKPDFNLNSFGIQYKEKNVKYTEDLMKDDKDDEDFAIRERNYEALSTGGGKPDKSLLLDVDKPAVKKIKNNDDYESHVEETQRGNEDHNQTEAQRMNFLKPSKPTKGVPTGLPKLAKSADEIILKTLLLKLDLMKDSKDGKQSKDGLPIKNGELKDLISDDDTSAHVAEATRLGNDVRDNNEDFEKRFGFKNTPKNWKRGFQNRMSGGTKESLKSQTAETVFKAISLKLDLIKTTGKNQGDVNKPVTEGDDREVFTNIEGNDAHQNPPPVGGGGFAGKGRRRMVNGVQEIVGQTSEETVPKINDVPTSTLGDVVNAKDATPKKVTDAQKLITENPTTVDGKGTIDPAIASGDSGEVSTWNGGLKGEKGGSSLGGKTNETAAVESDKEDKENKFINDDTSKWLNSPAGKKSAAARKKREDKIIAAGGTVNHAASEIDSMTDGMKELFKGLNGSDAGEEADGKTGFTGKVHEKDGTVSDWQNGQHTVRGHGVGKPKKELKPREVKTSTSEINDMTDGMKELMKEYDRSKDVLADEGIEQGEGDKKGKVSFETPCFNCGRAYKKGETELKNIAANNKRRAVLRDREEEDHYKGYGRDL